MYNKAMLMGNLGKDPEIRSLNNGDEVASFTLATSETWKDKASGEKKTKTEWHNVVVFGATVNAVKFLKKGSKVAIEGKIQTRKWADSNGNDKYTTEIVLQAFNGNLIFLDSKGDSQQEGFGSHIAKEDTKVNAVNDLEDEIPF